MTWHLTGVLSPPHSWLHLHQHPRHTGLRCRLRLHPPALSLVWTHSCPVGRGQVRDSTSCCCCCGDKQTLSSPVYSVCCCPCRAEHDLDNHQYLCPFRKCFHFLPNLHYTAHTHTHTIYHWLIGWDILSVRSPHPAGHISISLHGAVGVSVTGVKGQSVAGLPGIAAHCLVSQEPRFTASTLIWALKEQRQCRVYPAGGDRGLCAAQWRLTTELTQTEFGTQTSGMSTHSSMSKHSWEYTHTYRHCAKHTPCLHCFINNILHKIL